MGVSENSRFNSALLSVKSTKDVLTNCAKGQTFEIQPKIVKKTFTNANGGAIICL